jgi:hypothetical protein
VFECHEGYDSAVCRCFESRGFTLFALHRSRRRPLLIQPGTPAPGPRWEALSFLATRDPARARARFARRGWMSLAGRSRPARARSAA